MPFHGYHHGGPWGHYHGGGPSRFLWFILGGIAASWFWRAKTQKALENGAHGYGRWEGGYDERRMARLEAWKEEKAKLHAFGSQASETVADITEASLDSVLAAVETLKIKLAEQRARRAAALRHDQIPPEAYPS